MPTSAAAAAVRSRRASLLDDTITKHNAAAKTDEIKQRVYARRREQQQRQSKKHFVKKERKSSVLSSLDFWESNSSMTTQDDDLATIKALMSSNGSNDQQTPTSKVGRAVTSKQRKRVSSTKRPANGPPQAASAGGSNDDGAAAGAGAASGPLHNDAASCISDDSLHSSKSSSCSETPRHNPKRYSRRGSVTKHKLTADDTRLQPNKHLLPPSASAPTPTPDDSSICTSTSAYSTRSAPTTLSSAKAAANNRHRRRSSQRRGSMVGSMSTDMPTPGTVKRAVDKPRRSASGPLTAERALPPPPCIDEAPLGSLIPSPELRRRRPNRGTKTQKPRSSSCHATVSYPSANSGSSRPESSSSSFEPAPAASTKPAKSRSSLSKLSKLPTVNPTPSCAASRSPPLASPTAGLLSPASKSRLKNANGRLKQGIDDVTVSTAETSSTTNSLLSGDSLSSSSSNEADNSSSSKEPTQSKESIKEDPLSRSAHGRLQEHAKSGTTKFTTSSRSGKKVKKPQEPHDKERREVHFSSVNVQEYPIMLGDNPSVTAGAPLTIGWVPIASYELNVDLHQHMRKRRSPSKLTSKKDAVTVGSSSPTVNNPNTTSISKSTKEKFGSTALALASPATLPKSTKRHRHTARKEMYLSEHTRAQMLLRAGYCLADIVDAGLEVQRIQKERAESLRKQQWEIVRDVFSKAGTAFSRILSVDTSVQMILYPRQQLQQQQQQQQTSVVHKSRPTSVCPKMA